MNSLAQYLVEGILEDTRGVTVLLPGGFKPPHGGHLDLAMAYFGSPKVSKVIVLVGPKPRDGVTREKSIAIWKSLTKDIPNIEILPTDKESPLAAAYEFVENTESGIYALGASKKGKDYARVKQFVQDHNPGGKYYKDGVQVVEVDVNTRPIYYTDRTDNNNGKGISASVLRNDISNKDAKNFATNYPDVPTDLVTKIYKTLTSNITEILSEGGAAGHLAHPYESIDLSFQDVENMINAALSGKLSLAQEKLDGQNLMVSYKNGRVVAARNKTQIKNFGENSLSIEQMKKQFSNRGAIQVAFVEAMRDFEAAISNLSPQEKEEIFGNGRGFISLEILYPDTTNVIPYGAAQLRLHHLKTYDENGNVVSEDQAPIEKLQTAIEQQKSQNQKTYQIRKTDPATIKPDKDYVGKIEEFTRELKGIMSKFNLTKSDKIATYFYRWWKDYITQNAKNYKYSIPKEVKKLLIRRWAFTDKSTSIRNILQQIDNEDFSMWVKEMESGELKTQKKIAGRPIEMLFLKLGARVLKNIDNLASANPDQSVRQIKTNLKTAIQAIRDAAATPDYEDAGPAMEFLKRELRRLKELGGYKAIVPTEGLVFTYNGKLYKLTGAFAPINQILGYLRF